VVLSNGTLLSNKSGSLKESTQTIDNCILQGVFRKRPCIN